MPQSLPLFCLPMIWASIFAKRKTGSIAVVIRGLLCYTAAAFHPPEFQGRGQPEKHELKKY
jgi:hypothetical protein